jgi:hypothetical protein
MVSLWYDFFMTEFDRQSALTALASDDLDKHDEVWNELTQLVESGQASDHFTELTLFCSELVAVLAQQDEYTEDRINTVAMNQKVLFTLFNLVNAESKLSIVRQYAELVRQQTRAQLLSSVLLKQVYFTEFVSNLTEAEEELAVESESRQLEQEFNALIAESAQEGVLVSQKLYLLFETNPEQVVGLITQLSPTQQQQLVDQFTAPSTNQDSFDQLVFDAWLVSFDRSDSGKKSVFVQQMITSLNRLDLDDLPFELDLSEQLLLDLLQPADLAFIAESGLRYDPFYAEYNPSALYDLLIKRKLLTYPTQKPEPKAFPLEKELDSIGQLILYPMFQRELYWYCQLMTLAKNEKEKELGFSVLIDSEGKKVTFSLPVLNERGAVDIEDQNEGTYSVGYTNKVEGHFHPPASVPVPSLFEVVDDDENEDGGWEGDLPNMLGSSIENSWGELIALFDEQRRQLWLGAFTFSPELVKKWHYRMKSAQRAQFLAECEKILELYLDQEYFEANHSTLTKQLAEKGITVQYHLFSEDKTNSTLQLLKTF